MARGLEEQQQTPATLAVYLVLYTHEIQLQFVLVSCLAWWHRGNDLTSFPEEQINLRYRTLCENCALMEIISDEMEDGSTRT